MLDGRFRFDNFVVGAANRLAVSAVRAVADTPGVVYNPLFIYSSSGLGKTHLLGALGVQVKHLHPDLAVEYATLDDFVDQLHAAIASGQAEAFKRRYQSIGVLLLDDVQFLTGKPETQSEMLRVLNALQASGRQVVMTSDRPPTEIADVDQRLVTRLSGGLIVDIGAPDYETRVAILRHKCQERGAHFQPGVLEELARGGAANVRELQGTLNRLIAQQAILDSPIGVDEARSLIGSGHAPALPNEFESFLSDVAVAVAQHVEGWRARLSERISHWTRQGFRTGPLDRAMAAPEMPPDLEALDAQFAATVERLRALEAEAVRLNPAHAGLTIFRDPERVAEAEAFVASELASQAPLPAPNADLTFKTLHATRQNELAVKAAREIVEHPASRYNPLVVVGSYDKGKTHLVHAIANALLEKDASHRVACTNGNAFVEELIAAVQQGTIERWRSKYRSADAFVLDGLDALLDKELTQDELFHLFNALVKRGAQLVFSARHEPSALGTLAERLRSRLEGGLVVHVTAPAPVRGVNAPLNAKRQTPRNGTPTGLDPSLVGVADSFFLDFEKVVVDWPDADGLLIEEMR
ncbi:MAG TPA: DnaA/Hda family protein [Gemmatimonadaceae bacterium]|nr:DnaA/Hda family protein [Gemmatimonadaceae bacterium]